MRCMQVDVGGIGNALCGVTFLIRASISHTF
jgi:hypothetical protein